MNATKKQTNWTEFLKLFSEQNRFRPTRLGVFEGKPGEMRDYWLEDGLPLAGIDVDAHGEGAPTVEIMLGKNDTADSPTMTHVIRGVRSANIVLSPGGDDDGLEIKDADGNTTFLRFED